MANSGESATAGEEMEHSTPSANSSNAPWGLIETRPVAGIAWGCEWDFDIVEFRKRLWKKMVHQHDD
jgi:hypothetical protein